MHNLKVLECEDVELLIALGVITDRATEWEAYVALAAVVRDPLVVARTRAAIEAQKPFHFPPTYAEYLAARAAMSAEDKAAEEATELSSVIAAMSPRERTDLRDRILPKLKTKDETQRLANAPRPF